MRGGEDLMRKYLARMFPELAQGWSKLSHYERFERLVSLILTLAISAVVLVALLYLVTRVFTLLFLETRNPFDYRAFQAIFDMILTVLIAMEFNNSIVRTMREGGRVTGLIQVQVVVLIGIMALVRKLILMELDTLDSATILAVSAGIIALGITYWFLSQENQPREIALRRRRSSRED